MATVSKRVPEFSSPQKNTVVQYLESNEIMEFPRVTGVAFDLKNKLISEYGQSKAVSYQKIDSNNIVLFRNNIDGNLTATIAQVKPETGTLVLGAEHVLYTSPVALGASELLLNGHAVLSFVAETTNFVPMCMVVKCDVSSDTISVTHGPFNILHAGHSNINYTYAPSKICFDGASKVYIEGNSNLTSGRTAYVAELTYNSSIGTLTLVKPHYSSLYTFAFGKPLPSSSYGYAYSDGIFIEDGKLVYMCGLSRYLSGKSKFVIYSGSHVSGTDTVSGQSVVGDTPELSNCHFRKVSDNIMLICSSYGSLLTIKLVELSFGSGIPLINKVIDEVTILADSPHTSNVFSHRLKKVVGSDDLFVFSNGYTIAVISVKFGKVDAMSFRTTTNNSKYEDIGFCASLHGEWLLVSHLNRIFSLKVIGMKRFLDWGIYSDTGEYVSSGYAHVGFNVGVGKDYYFDERSGAISQGSNGIYIGKGVVGNYIYIEKEAGI